MIHSTSSAGARLGKKRFLLAAQVRLCALLLAAVGGAASWRAGSFDIFGCIALISFIVALATQYFLSSVDPEQRWYEGRAAAESIKTMAWRYAVGGSPFPVTANADQSLLDGLNDVLADLESISAPLAGKPGEQITTTMRDLRRQSLGERRAVYLQKRLNDQADWYAKKAIDSEKLLNTFTVASIILEFGGIVGATLKAFAMVDVDLLGIVAAAAAGMAAWTQAQAYAHNKRSYSVAYHELAGYRSKFGSVTDDAWAQYVADVEDAISREHNLWRSSKGIDGPNPRLPDVPKDQPDEPSGRTHGSKRG